MQTVIIADKSFEEDIKYLVDMNPQDVIFEFYNFSYGLLDEPFHCTNL